MPTHRRYRKAKRTINYPGDAHELTFTCQHRLQLLSKDRTRGWFIEALDQARKKWNFALWAYVIMPEHAHVLLYPRSLAYSIEDINKSIKQSVARRATIWLRKHAPEFLETLKIVRPDGKIEYRFWLQGGGYDRNLDESQTAWRSVAYLHNNPVRRGLAERVIDWPWSSARWYARLDDVKLDMDGMPPDMPEWFEV